MGITGKVRASPPNAKKKRFPGDKGTQPTSVVHLPAGNSGGSLGELHFSNHTTPGLAMESKELVVLEVVYQL